MARRFKPFGADFSNPLSTLRREMDSLFDQFFRDEDGTAPERLAPSVDVAESETAFEITVELPGVRSDDIDVELQEGQLVIRGEKKKEQEDKEKTFHRVERYFGQFQRLIPLTGPVDEEKVTADFTDGVLRIKLPKSADVKPRKITVNS